ncbi:MAG: SsrA-binding protein [Bacteroidetes bacterium QH_2_67_10]|jgi:SsrA-binding protein|nr:MAG: SsrA-binding protein [Bacteroidetes bacterium QH_2_67_10]
MSEKVIARNRRASYEYEIEDTLEAGLQLKGSEVKSLRSKGGSIKQAYCSVDRDGEMILHGAHIPTYEPGGEHFNHEPRRNRKLLMHKREIVRWGDRAERGGYTIVPLQLYFREGYAKLEIGLGKGKKQHDKRQSIKERESERRMQRELRQH